MGDRLAGRGARQRSDLSGTSERVQNHGGTTSPAFRTAVLTLLAVDGVISAVLGAVFVQSRLGSAPFPISALISGLVNAALVWAGLQVTSSSRVAALPLWTWLLTVAVLTFGGPGGGIVFGGPGIDGISALVLLVVGVLPPAWVLWRRRHRV
ncbi:MAG TPA: hypothetical protein VKI00_13875 [Mycobacterium sp.]|uniref:hypothetical protein n=1 Tax=Mycobacterium sp. TaxID=1785 RepID=UPI002C675FC5|nr:hypothetical protein [Mycobacterium sp.]HME76691.1 hypothetical protein [Mycobacterium sp.]